MTHVTNRERACFDAGQGLLVYEEVRSPDAICMRVRV